MNNDLIQWPTAKYWTAQWNPIIGCKPCSPACEHCYAKAWADRFCGGEFTPRATNQRPPRKGVVFCGNMTDLFGEWLGDKPTNYISSLINWRSDAIYLWCTKHPKNMCEALKPFATLSTFNHYFGFTAENQGWYDRRRNDVCKHFPYWANLWISAEPLLGEIDMRLYNYWMLPKWLVVGCESGPNRRPCKLEWVESIVEQCRAANVPVFVKQISINGRCVTDITKFPKHLQIRQVPWTTKGGAQ